MWPAALSASSRRDAEGQASFQQLANRRLFAGLDYRTRLCWSTKRHVIGKAEWTVRPRLASGGEASNRLGSASPRCNVTNIRAAHGPARSLHEDVYGQRGEEKNRLKE